MKKLILLIVFMASHYASASPFDNDRFVLGATPSVRFRQQVDELGEQTHNRFQYSLRMTVDAKVIGCFKVKLAAISGSNYNSAWNNTGLGFDDSDTTKKFAARNMLLSCAWSSGRVEVGALEPVAAGTDIKGALSLDGDGWIDGARVVQNINLKKGEFTIDQMIVTVGDADSTESLNFFNRDLDKISFVQVQVQGRLSSEITYVLEGTHIDVGASKAATQLRAKLEASIANFTAGLVDQITLDSLWSAESGVNPSLDIDMSKRLGKWEFTAGYFYNDDYSYRDLREDFSAERGGHARITISRDLSQRFVWFVRYRQGLHGFGEEEHRVETGIKGNFNTKKPKSRSALYH